MYEEMLDLEEKLSDELVEVVETLCGSMDSAISNIQPPSSVVRLAVRAMVNVLLSFERGYRMSKGEE